MFGHKEYKDLRRQRSQGTQQQKAPKSDFSVARPPGQLPGITRGHMQACLQHVDRPPSWAIAHNLLRASLGTARGEGGTVIWGPVPQARLGWKDEGQKTKHSLCRGSQGISCLKCFVTTSASPQWARWGKVRITSLPLSTFRPQHGPVQTGACHRRRKGWAGLPGVCRIGLDYN